MIEPLRSQYLAVLGIENYVPRFVLPYAKLSEPCEWLDASIESAMPAVLVDENVIAESAVEQNALSEKSVQRAPIIGAEIKRPSRVVENSTAKASAAQGEAGPQFALSVVLAAGGILLIDAAPASSAERTAFQALLNNMLPALRPAAAQYVLDIFLWPMTKQPKISRDADAAKETLSAYLNKQIKQRAIDVVLLLGEAAQQWCVLENEVRVIKSSSLLACVKDPALKRPLWNDIRHIAEK
ncbi:MAG: hypothetical protein QM709_08145 [Spongiibacteraceae bacterium]